MCGILGQINLVEPINQQVFNTMLDTLAHRGPDGRGIHVNPSATIAFGHRRLSFLDLTEAGTQPMLNQEGNIWITFNGEIYNYLELRESLKAKYSFKTGTDTEVLLAAYRTWGIDFVHRLKGMFAFALYDETQNKLFLVRDRFGIKPLYYYKHNNGFIFASELKAIMASGIVPKEVDFSAFADYFVYRYIPSPKTIWKQVCKVPPACFLEIDTKDLSVTETEYYTLPVTDTLAEEGRLIAEVQSILLQSVREHTRADVPIGSFLSGGYDSSALVYLMTRAGQNPSTFSIGFKNWDKSEDQYAKIVANHLGVNNTAVVADENSLKYIDIMAAVYDEPIADISIVPTYLVSKLARNEVKAVLSGEGADEAFGGYTWQHEFMKKYHSGKWFTRLFKPNPSVDIVSFYAQAMAMGWFDAEEFKKMLHPNLHQYIPDDVHWFYRKNVKPQLTPLKSIQYLDIKCFMGELVLTKIDRASMANSLEVRVPFLDHHLMEKIFSINESSYFKPNQTKFLLYKNINMYLPEEILERKKQGFVGPDSYYMDMAFYKSQLADSVLVKNDIINQSYLDELFTQSYNWKLWKILIMEKWFSQWIDSAN